MSIANAYEGILPAPNAATSFPGRQMQRITRRRRRTVRWWDAPMVNANEMRAGGGMIKGSYSQTHRFKDR